MYMSGRLVEDVFTDQTTPVALPPQIVRRSGWHSWDGNGKSVHTFPEEIRNEM